MNRDQFRSKWIQFKGGLKKREGKMTGDRTLQVKEALIGSSDGFRGKTRAGRRTRAG
jgi:uncharacterized protein YjbJ (UPF0337 family)